MTEMSQTDIVLCVILAASFIYGVWRGLILQLASLGGLIAGIVAARLFSGGLAGWLLAEFPTTLGQQGATVVAMCVLFLAGYAAATLLGRFIHKLSHALLAAWLDHLAGGVLGLAKALIFLSLIANLYLAVTPSGTLPPCRMLGANLTEWITGLAPKLFGICAEHFGV